MTTPIEYDYPKPKEVNQLPHCGKNNMQSVNLCLDL